VLALRNALYAIEWPDDELRVFATIRGPLFALHDDTLLIFRQAHGGLHPLRWVDPARRESLAGDEREVADALAVLGRLHRPRNRRAIAETITRLLGEVRAHAGLAIWPTGEQALANCLRIVELARAFERRGAPSFRAFVESLEEEAEEGRSAEAPVVEEGTEGVRIMTVHRAKGLEFPVVILADPTCHATAKNPSRHVGPVKRLWVEPLCQSVPPDLRDAAPEGLRRDAEEAVRIAYVAATRVS
jgi:ATP-dependent helicase/nuclease subunit A